MKGRKRKRSIKEIVEDGNGQPNAKERQGTQIEREWIFEKRFQIFGYELSGVIINNRLALST